MYVCMYVLIYVRTYVRSDNSGVSYYGLRTTDGVQVQVQVPYTVHYLLMTLREGSLKIEATELSQIR